MRRPPIEQREQRAQNKDGSLGRRWPLTGETQEYPQPDGGAQTQAEHTAEGGVERPANRLRSQGRGGIERGGLTEQRQGLREQQQHHAPADQPPRSPGAQG